MTPAAVDKTPAPAPAPASASTSASPGAGGHLAFIDALRGYAILGVMFTHLTTHFAGIPTAAVVAGLYGRNGVQLFFLVSACTLFWSIHLNARDEPRPLAAFFLRRLFRIGPLFWAAIPFYLIYNGVGPNFWAPRGLGWPQVLATVGLVHGWHPTAFNSVVPGGWSVGVEAVFYLGVPAIFVSIKSAAQAFRYGLIVSLLARFFLATLDTSVWAARAGVPADLWSAYLDFSFLNQLPSFFFGVTLYFLMRDRRRRDAAWIVPVAVLVGGVTVLGLGGGVGQLLLNRPAAASLLLLAFAWAVMTWPTRWLVHPAVRWLGTVSFSAYIWHWVVLDAVRHAVVPALATRYGPVVALAGSMAVLVLGTTALASVSYYAIERPGQRLGRLCVGRLAARPTGVSDRVATA